MDAKPISTPVSSGQKLSAYVGEPHTDLETYRSIVGALQYLTITCPDLSYVVNQPGSLQVNAFSDADYAGDPDSRHSTSGYCVYVGANLVS
ncbi:uncharacterized protein LOC110758209 [Prunus avium]|uniref:Uncharacterized protein LOC110758209 n=1 Tax=Prunus avium TaxID=42229 RepID=A0A6P5SI78_PRUAV|nr:uncharacterized protein LOC110758209 [Prunus avium]